MINTAIKRAIEGGYKWENWQDGPEEMLLLDPQFWQALGKAMHWGSSNKCPTCGKVLTSTGWSWDWETEWHNFIRALASGKTAEEAMGEIIK